MINHFLLQHLLDETAAKYPNNTAIKIREDSITYKDLDEKSNRLANILIEIGFMPRNAVAIYLNKSIETIIAIFAILKAGGTYIPLDSHYSPIARIKNIIKLSNAKFIITNINEWNKLDEEIKDYKVIFVDDFNRGKKDIKMLNSFSNIIGKHFFYDNSSSNRLITKSIVTDDDLAYILYTSGSTGTPKGVMISHLNALTFIRWVLSFFKPLSTDVFSNHAPLHFDLSIFDIYVSIASGGCLNMVPPEINNNPRALVKWISENKISYWYSVPSVWVSILNYASTNQYNLIELKNILFAGEVFPPKYLRKLMEILPNCSFYNLYGPTETNVCTYYHVKDREDILDRPVPIGRACSNTEVLALNEHDELLSVGEEGELLVRGSIVTKGYYKDEERTKEVFRTSPFSYHNGAMLYKTGDIVRKLDDDLYEYVGRKDLMVKCAGFRIELQEIENALYQIDAIEETVVVQVVNKEKVFSSIYALVKMKNGIDVPIIEIKKKLLSNLPKYMIPEIIEKVHEIPKNANGKVDRQKAVEWFKNII